MARVWERRTRMGARPVRADDEIWTLRDDPNSTGHSYPVRVRYGKPLDVLSLKVNVVSDFGEQIAQIRTTRTAAYASGRTGAVTRCPICGAPAERSEFQVAIYGGRYHQCADCTHCFIINPPAGADLEAFYTGNAHFASTYTDARITQTRVQQVARPKAEWVIERFRERYGRAPASLLDVGAGGGHFVAACRQLGLDAQGIEVSPTSRAFCRSAFGIELLDTDLEESARGVGSVDVLTFWNVLEHVPEPMRLLGAAQAILSGRPGLIVAEVPRWDGLTTGIQRRFSETVVRHLEPLSHVQCFTDSSLATAFTSSGFVPVAAWYFGMDAYELMMQLSFRVAGDSRLVTDTLGAHIPALQEALDLGRLSDVIVLAGAPRETS